MENLQKFVSAVAVIVITGVIFGAVLRRDVQFGSVADWAGAAANFAAVSVALWIALSDRRQKAAEEAERRRKSRSNLLSALEDLLELGETVTRGCADGAFPDAAMRRRLQYDMQAIVLCWQRVEERMLTEFDAAVLGGADGPFHDLRHALSAILAQPANSETVQDQFPAVRVASSELRELRELLG